MQNCGFEGPTSTGTFGNPQPTGYTVTGSNGGGFYGYQSNAYAHSGSNAYTFGDFAPGSTTLAQTLTTTVGTPYQISFFAYNFTGAAGPQNGLTVTFGALMLRAGPLTNSAYQQFTYTGVATSASTTLAFTGYNNLSANLLDDLSVTALTTTAPEPSTWALLGTGLLAVGGLARRRRRGSV